MALQDSPRDESDESFLDLLFERAVAALEEGHSLSVSELLGGREDLRREVERLVLDARSVACVRPDELPSVRGYTMIEELGRGGMGAVYLARQDALGGRRVALKLLPAAASATARSRTRFLNEARILANVRHPNVVTVHDVIESDSVCAYAMEWVDGASLSQLIQRARSTAVVGRQPELKGVTESLALEPARAAESYAVFICRVGLAIARALAALHRAGLVHRDVKPSNVLLRRDGTALLSDFGLVQSSEAGLTKTGEFVGTVLYASPEQLEGESERLDARSDIYSLGVTLYQALTLHLPFDEASADSKRATTPTGMLRLIESRSAVPLRARDRSLPRDLETIVATAIETDPTRRYASADELADDLERLLSLQPIRARPASALSRAVKFVRRNRSAARGLIAGSAASIALALLAVVCFVFAPRWADEHVREARLALLDPVYANALFVREQFGAPASAPRTLLTDDGLRRALTSYEAALRWNWFDRSIGAERDVVARALDHETPEVSATDPRLAGLGAYLAGDVDGALEHWSDAERLRDPRATADPLVEAMLGVLLLVRDEPARAYPRLREACRMFPDVGFLATYHADAAVRCGDHETAERLLRSARDMPRLDPLGAHERVTADLYSATGRDDEAESLYRATTQSPIAALHLARLLDRCGRLDEAIEQYLVALQRLSAPALRAEFATVLERWWASLSDSERSQAIAATLELSPTDPHSLVARLRELRLAPVEDEKPRNSGLFATLRRWRSSPPLQSLGLPELAGILEVHDMEIWHRVLSFPPIARAIQSIAWRSPCPRIFSRLLASTVNRMRQATMPSLRDTLLVCTPLSGLATASGQCWVTYDASLGTLPTAQCFWQGGAGNPPPPSVSGGRLHIGPTSTTEALYFQSDCLAIDFDQGVVMEAQVEVVDAECGLPLQLPRFGFGIEITDRLGRVAFVQLCSTQAFLGNSPILAQDGVNVVVVPYAVQGVPLTVRLDASSGGLELRLNGALAASAPLGTALYPANAPHVWFGDGTGYAGGDSYVTQFRMTTDCIPPSTYCTAGTTTNGCNATMSASGTPSIGATSGFTVSCSSVEGQKFGLIFYGVNGPKASPWAPGSSSVLCVKAPVQRTAASNSGGTPGACDGSFALDFLAYLASHPGALGQPFAAGHCVNAQTWFRDPPAPGTTNLSNALQFVMTP